MTHEETEKLNKIKERCIFLEWRKIEQKEKTIGNFWFVLEVLTNPCSLVFFAIMYSITRYM